MPTTQRLLLLVPKTGCWVQGKITPHPQFIKRKSIIAVKAKRVDPLACSPKNGAHRLGSSILASAEHLFLTLPPKDTKIVLIISIWSFNVA
jgi:hypothetical protein